MTNIIQFPLDRRMDEMLWQELEKELVENNDEQIIVEELLSDFISCLHDMSFPIDDEKFVYDISFLYESMKSLILKFHDKNHPIQNFAHNLYNEQIEHAKAAQKQLELNFD